MELTLYDLLLLKEKNHGDKLIYIKFNNHSFVFKLLTADEYTQCKILTMDKYTFSDAICQLALIYPEDFSFTDTGLGGIADYMAKKIIKYSMIFDDEKLVDILEKKRTENESFLNQCKYLIKAAFQEYSLEEINNWSYLKIMEMTAAGEEILKYRGVMDADGQPLRINFEIDEEKLKEKKKNPTDLELWEKGIDPMVYNIDKIQLKKPLVDEPFIMGPEWNDEELNKKVGRQILRR